MTLRFLVRGLVQGVGFRYFVLRRATALGLPGWTSNLPDGRVEVVAQGQPTQLAQLERSLREGPATAHVDEVEKLEISDDIEIGKSFRIR